MKIFSRNEILQFKFSWLPTHSSVIVQSCNFSVPRPTTALRDFFTLARRRQLLPTDENCGCICFGADDFRLHFRYVLLLGTLTHRQSRAHTPRRRYSSVSGTDYRQERPQDFWLGGSVPHFRLRRRNFENLTTKWCILKYRGLLYI